MVECPTCKISFSPRHRLCPRCRAYEANLEDRAEYLANTAEIALDQGVPLAEVESMLLEEGMPSLVAHEIVCARALKVKRAARRYALVRLLGGSGILLLASILTLVGVFTLPSRIGVRLLAAGLFLGAAGAWPFILGIYSLMTGRDR
jgi:hypothetical protein